MIHIIRILFLWFDLSKKFLYNIFNPYAFSISMKIKNQTMPQYRRCNRSNIIAGCSKPVV